MPTATSPRTREPMWTRPDMCTQRCPPQPGTTRPHPPCPGAPGSHHQPDVRLDRVSSGLTLPGPHPALDARLPHGLPTFLRPRGHAWGPRVLNCGAEPPTTRAHPAPPGPAQQEWLHASLVPKLCPHSRRGPRPQHTARTCTCTPWAAGGTAMSARSALPPAALLRSPQS